VTQHFAPAEFACPHCGAVFVRPRLLEALEKLRAMRGRPIRVVSGYRCPQHNAAVGGARNSQHVYAAAADIPRGSCTNAEAVRAGFTGIGTKDGLPVHVDVRDGQLTTWVY
jgi:uncharacterized protein YcbK (DUF882 family)